MKLLIFLFLFVSHTCVAQSFNFNQGGPTTKNYYEEIPYEKVGHHLFITCEVAGKQRRFLFDTGAPVAISKQLINELQAKPLAQVIMQDLFLNKDSSTVYDLNNIKLGTLNFEHIPALDTYLEIYKCMNMDGVIGSNMLRHSIVSFDSKRKLIILTDKKHKLNLKAKNSGKLGYKHSNQSDPQIYLNINRKVNLILPFDTGDSDFIRINEHTINLLSPYKVIDSLRAGYGSAGIGAFGAQKYSPQKLVKLAPFTIGNAKFTNLTTMSQRQNLPALGNGILDHGTLTLDFINSKFYFDAYQDSVDLAKKAWPVAYGFLDGKIAVAVVWDDSKALAEPGEQILAIDDKNVSNMDICEYINGPYLLEGKETTVLTIKDKHGEVKKLSMTKR